MCVFVCVYVRVCMLSSGCFSRQVVSSPSVATSFYFKEFGCVEAYCAPCLFFVSLRVLLFGRHPDRTSGELMAVLTQLQLSGFPNRGILNQWCCVVCSVWHVGRICGAYRRLVDELPDLALTAPVFRINEDEYLFMKVIVLCGGS